MKRETLVIDLEADGLCPSEIFVLSIMNYDTWEITSYTSEDNNIVDGLLRMQEAEIIIAHYGLGYDIKVIEDLTGGLVKIDRSRVFDTCEQARKYFPGQINYKLRTFGDILGYPKGDWNDFSKFDRGMIKYCETDVYLTAYLARALFEVICDQ